MSDLLEISNPTAKLANVAKVRGSEGTTFADFATFARGTLKLGISTVGFKASERAR